MRKGFFLRLAVNGIRKNRKVYYPYILTAIVTTAMMYIIGTLQGNPDVGNDTLSFALQLGVIVTSLFSVIFLFYTNSFLIKRRKKEFGLYNILGMEKKHLGRVVLWETVIILVISLALGFALGMLLDKALLLLLARIVGRQLAIGFYISRGAMTYTAALISGTFALIFLNSVRQVYTANPIELLRSGEVGEREPKTKWIIAILGLLTLGTGYWLSATIRDAATMIIMFFFAVILVIIGTYFLFTAGSIALLKTLRKRKRFYYKPSHFISVSGMIYRMKQNAVGLSNVCILSTMVLVMVFSTVALWFNMEDIVNKRVSGDIEFVSKDLDIDAFYETVDETLSEMGLTRENDMAFRYYAFTAFQTRDTFHAASEADDDNLFITPIMLYLVPLEDYNRMYGLSETLSPGEILLDAYRSDYTYETLSLLGETLSIKSRTRGRLSNHAVFTSAYDTLFLIMDNQQSIDRLIRRNTEVYGYKDDAMRCSVSFTIDGTAEQEIAFSDALYDRLKQRFSITYLNSREALRISMRQLYGSLLFVGIFLACLFLMAMILIIYYKQISEGYDDRERYRIMRKVGLSRREIKHSISSQILIVFFLPLAVAGLHIVFAFPGINTMFRGLGMDNVSLMGACALASFAVFGVIYGAVYLLTAKVYYRIVSE